MAVPDQVRGVKLGKCGKGTSFSMSDASANPWAAFRAESIDLLSKQPLSGHVVVLINHLDGSTLMFPQGAE